MRYMEELLEEKVLGEIWCIRDLHTDRLMTHPIDESKPGENMFICFQNQAIAHYMSVMLSYDYEFQST